MTDVGIVGEVRLYRDGLADVLDRRDGLRVVGTASTLEEAMRLVDERTPDVVLVDLAIADGIRAVRALTARTCVVVLAVPDLDSEILACAEAGIAGLVTRDASIAELVESIVSAAQGELACTPHVAGVLLRRVAAVGRPPTEPTHRPLTPRERQIVALIEEGLSNKEIARRLYIEVATVKNHVHNILEKLQVSRRHAAAELLRQAGSRSSSEPYPDPGLNRI